MEAFLTEAGKLKDQINDMDTKPKWEPKEGIFCIEQTGEVFQRCYFSNMPKTVAFGFTRNTKEKAEQAASIIKQYNRLLAYVDEFESGIEDSCKVYTIFYNSEFNHYEYFDVEYSNKILCEVRMSYECAKNLTAKLNSREVVL